MYNSSTTIFMLTIQFKVKVDHCRNDNFLEDFCDGKKAMSHPLFSSKVLSLQLIMYFDELEVCNPLGSSRKKHKLGSILIEGEPLCMFYSYMYVIFFTYTGFFYFVLGNVRPKYRSALKSIQLVAICKNKHLKEYGLNSILETIVNDVHHLEEVWSA